MNDSDRRKYTRNIVLYYCYFVAVDPWFWGVILISSLMNLAHMTLSEIYFMESVVMLLYTFFEVPSGALADYVGRKYTIFCGSLLIAFAILWFAIMDSAFDAWGANIVVMIGIAFCSGADRAFLSDTLHVLGRESELTKIQGRAMGLRWFVVAWTSLVCGYLAEIDLRLPLYLSVPNVVLACVFVVFFTEPFKRSSGKKKIQSFTDVIHVTFTTLRGVWRLMIVSLVFVVNNKRVKWIIGFFTLLSVSSKVWFFSYNPYFELVDLKYRYFGVLFCALNLIACISSFSAYKVVRSMKEKNVLMLVCGIIGVPIFLMGAFVVKGMASMVVMQNIARGLIGPLHIGMIDVYLTPENKATVQSISSATRGVAEFFVLACYGLLAAFAGLSNALMVLGAVVLFVGFWSMRKYTVYFS